MITQKLGIVNDIDYQINKTNLALIIGTATMFLSATYLMVI